MKPGSQKKTDPQRKPDLQMPNIQKLNKTSLQKMQDNLRKPDLQKKPHLQKP